MPDKLTLEEAQALLMQRRAQLKKKRETAVNRETLVSPDPSPTLTELTANLPSHLGWHSAKLTQHLQQTKSKPLNKH